MAEGLPARCRETAGPRLGRPRPGGPVRPHAEAGAGPAVVAVRDRLSTSTPRARLHALGRTRAVDVDVDDHSPYRDQIRRSKGGIPRRAGLKEVMPNDNPAPPGNRNGRGERL